MKHINTFEYDFKARFEDILNMDIPEWVSSSSDYEVESTNLDTFLQE